MYKKKRHVVPNKAGGWDVITSGSPRITKVFNTKTEAVDYATSLAKKEESAVYIHRMDGTISAKKSIQKTSKRKGNDVVPPRESQGYKIQGTQQKKTTLALFRKHLKTITLPPSSTVVAKYHTSLEGKISAQKKND